MAKKPTHLLRAFRVRPECAYCGVELNYSEYCSDYATIDHVVPRARGGDDSLSNKTLACLHCNHSKADAIDWPSPKFTLADILVRPQRNKVEECDYLDTNDEDVWK